MMWWIIFFSKNLKYVKDGPYENRGLAEYYMSQNLKPFSGRCIICSEENMNEAIMQKIMELSG